MGFSPIKSNSNLEQRLSHLLGELCVDWGFCISPEDAQKISSLERLTADEFANRVMIAEGFVAEHEKTWFRKLRRRFVDEFGGTNVCADDFD